MKKKFLATLILLAASASSQAELSEAQKLLAETESLTVESQTMPQNKPTRALEKASCLLNPSIDIEIASPVIGVIKNVRVKRGERVTKNQKLVELHSEVEKATLKLNRAQAEYGRRTIERNKDLYKKRLISEQERDEIIMNNRVFSYEVNQTRALIDEKTIRSPVDGVVVDTFLDPGEYVGEEPILQIVQLDPLYVEVVMPSNRFGSIQKGDTAEVLLDAPLNSKHQATVIITDPVLDAASGTFGIRLELPNPDYKLPSGLKCKIRFNIKVKNDD